MRALRQWLLAEGDACPDRIPGTFDWHELKPEDPRPNGNAGDYVYWYVNTSCSSRPIARFLCVPLCACAFADGAC
jgi:hypothetical protein